MKKILSELNKLAKKLLKLKGRKLVGARVFTNCLCLYFSTGGCLFYSKKGFNWGTVGSMYFTTLDYNRQDISIKLWDEHESLIKWYEEWDSASYARRLWLLMEYNIRYN